MIVYTTTENTIYSVVADVTGNMADDTTKHAMSSAWEMTTATSAVLFRLIMLR